AAVWPDFISQDRHDALVAELEPVLRRKRYMQGHWDAVIQNYKETERHDWAWSPDNAAAIKAIRESCVFPPDLHAWKPVHVIDLSAEGFISPHVDSVKFSGRIVAGLSLLSTSVMQLQREGSEEDPDPSSIIRMLLPPRSLYLLQHAGRYKFTHEIRPSSEPIEWEGEELQRGRRISLIFREEEDGSGNGEGTMAEITSQ
ncbi:unnamed protein product, partial [Chrysoparadoxa australica]